MSRKISQAANSVFTEFDTSIPELSDSADIEVAFRLYHYGTIADTPVADSIHSHLSNITNDIEFLQATPTGGGVVSIDVPHQLSVLSNNVNIPEGFIWLDSDGLSGSSISSGAGTLTNDMPLVSGASAHGVIWIDKDYLITDPFVISNFITQQVLTTQLSNYLTLSSASSTYATQITQITTSASSTYTLSLADNNDLLEFTSSSAITVSIPTEAVANFPIGSSLSILQAGTGQITVSPASGVTLNGTPGFKSRARWSLITLIKRGSNSWLIAGDLTV